HAGRDRGVDPRRGRGGLARCGQRRRGRRGEVGRGCRGMTFGAVAVRDAVGAVLAHTLRAGDRVLKKGRVLSASDVEALEESGHAEVVCARLDPDELAEDAAAARIATVLAGAGTRLERTHTGRTNLHAAVDGLVAVDAAAIARINAIDE